MKTNKTFGAALAAGVMAAGLVLSTSVAQAATVRLGPGDDRTNALGIDNLVLGGFFYNVTFQFDASTFVHDFLYPLEAYGDVLHPIALEVTAAVNDVLNTEPGVTTVGGNIDGFNQGSSYYFAFAEDRGTEFWWAAATVGEYSEGVGWILGDGEFEAPGGGRPGYDLLLREAELVNWALLESVGPVPIPGAVWLLGSGLVALGAVARRRRMAA